MPRINLTDRFIKTRKAAAPGRRDEYLDGLVPGLALRITDKGAKSFVLIARYPLNPKNPTRRALGTYGALSLDEARVRARDWLAMIHRGVDPRIEEGRRKASERIVQANTFKAVAEAFLDRYASKLAKSGEARAILEKEFIASPGKSHPKKRRRPSAPSPSAERPTRPTTPSAGSGGFTIGRFPVANMAWRPLPSPDSVPPISSVSGANRAAGC
jgi:hypothetical protein